MSNSKQKVSVFAPASIGNVSVGFDILGLCVSSDERDLGDVVSISAADKDEFHIAGQFADVLPTDAGDNLVLKARDLFAATYPEAKSDKLSIGLEKNLPICSGLGSSAASVVAAIHALNEFYGQPLSQRDCLHLMGECEAGASGSTHFDNIAPSYLGGLALCSNDAKLVHHLPWPKEWKLLLAYADIDIPTVAARKILPNEYDKQTLIAHAQNVAQFVHALHVYDLELAAHSIMDLVAEPYRQSLLPNFAQVKAELIDKYGVKAVGISGSGPTIFAIVDELTDVEAARNCLQTLYVDQSERAGKQGFVVDAKVNSDGAIRL